MEKVLCYGCLPIVFDKLLGTGGEHSSIVVVVTPLTAIMKDQVSGIVTIDDVCYLYLASPHTFQTGSDKTRNEGNGNEEMEMKKSLNLKAMHEGNTLILYYLTVEKPMVMNTRGRPMPLYNTR